MRSLRALPRRREDSQPACWEPASLPGEAIAQPASWEAASLPGEAMAVSPGAGDPPPALGRVQRWGVVAISGFSVLVLLAFQVGAIANHYAMRVTSDTPTFLALIRDLAVHPFRADSVFFGTASTHSIHASPYIQALALIWRLVSPHNGQFVSPLALGSFVAVVAIPVTLFTLGMLWLYTRELAGTTAAFIAIPALLSLFGPAHVTFASDLTLNGFLDAGYFPATFATGTMLATLLMLRRQSWPWTVGAVATATLTITTDPLVGVVLAFLMIAHACASVRTNPNDGLRVSLILCVALVLGRLWPVADIWTSFQNAKLPAPLLMLLALVAPQLWLRIRRWFPSLFARSRRALASATFSDRAELAWARVGAWSVLMLGGLAFYTIGHWPADQPVLRAYRLGFYWNDQRDRWLLLLAPSLCGLIAVVRLARRGRPELLVWFSGFFAAGFVGVLVHLTAGVQIPLYYRFILICQVPLAVAVAVFLTRHKSAAAAKLVTATLVFAFTFKALTLLFVSPNVNYFGSHLQSAWNLGRAIAPRSGLVAADPSTSYFIPVATGNHVFTMSMGHADSGQEPEQAQASYQVLREVYVGDAARASVALGRLWRAGVRWVVADKFTSMAPPDQLHLYFGPYTGLIGPHDAAYNAQYLSRLSAVGDEVYDDNEFSVFKLDRARLLQATSQPASISPPDYPRIRVMLDRLQSGNAAASAAAAPALYHLGVRMVTLSVGQAGARSRIYAYGQSLGTQDVVSSPVNSGRWSLSCQGICPRDTALSQLESLGTVAHEDPLFSTIVSLSPPGPSARGVSPQSSHGSKAPSPSAGNP